MAPTVGAFGALNQDSYDMFALHLAREARARGLDIRLVAAGPYPNARGESAPGRPLRGEALSDPAAMQALCAAVAGDARRSGAAECDILCMPCMSMTGFHAGVEQALGRPVVKMADALAGAYRDTPRLGVIHMRPAAARVAEIFGDRAVTPDAAFAARLLAAEEEAKKTGDPAPVEAVMRDIVEAWREQGVTTVLFARADAPRAELGPAGRVEGVRTGSYFGALARMVAARLAERAGGVACALLFTACLACVPARAQAPAVPGGVEPGRVNERVTIEAPLPRVDVERAQKPPQTAPAPEGYDALAFTLSAVEIGGMTVYDPARMRPLYAGLLGREVSLADIHALAQQMTAMYRNDGYILSQVVIPAQEIDGGRVRLLAVEGFVDKVYVKGAPPRKEAFIARFADRVARARPLRNRDLERAVLLVGDLPGLDAESVLAPSPDTQGAADLTIVVKREKTLEGYAQADNRGSRYLGPWQLNAGVTAGNALGLLESLRLSFALAPEHIGRYEMKHAGVDWMQAVNALGTTVSAGASITSTHPGYLLSPFDTRGVARAVRLVLSHPFIRARTRNLTGELKFDILNSERNDNLGLPKTQDRLRVARVAATWQAGDRLGGVTVLAAEASRGLGLFNASDKGGAANTRALGEPEFFKGTLDISRRQALPGAFELYAAATGQKSAHLLPASEEFGVGGARFGSAYDASELTGEDGVALRLELQKHVPGVQPLKSLQLYGFYDIGKVWNHDDAVVKDRRASIAGAGAGARFWVNDTFSGAIELAQPLTRPVAAAGDRGARAFFTLGARF